MRHARGGGAGVTRARSATSPPPRHYFRHAPAAAAQSRRRRPSRRSAFRRSRRRSRSRPRPLPPRAGAAGATGRRARRWRPGGWCGACRASPRPTRHPHRARHAVSMAQANSSDPTCASVDSARGRAARRRSSAVPRAVFPVCRPSLRGGTLRPRWSTGARAQGAEWNWTTWLDRLGIVRQADRSAGQLLTTRWRRGGGRGRGCALAAAPGDALPTAASRACCWHRSTWRRARSTLRAGSARRRRASGASRLAERGSGARIGRAAVAARAEGRARSARVQPAERALRPAGWRYTVARRSAVISATGFGQRILANGLWPARSGQRKKGGGS